MKEHPDGVYAGLINLQESIEKEKKRQLTKQLTKQATFAKNDDADQSDGSFGTDKEDEDDRTIEELLKEQKKFEQAMLDKANKNEEDMNKDHKAKLERYHGDSGMKEVGKAIIPF